MALIVGTCVVVYPLYPGGTGIEVLAVTVVENVSACDEKALNSAEALATPIKPPCNVTDTLSETLVVSPRVSLTCVAV